ncbi:unnamed protein product, partial [Mesorhabditis belari]|uniref:Uncharacterized protein n=1 Tax=Mesorhabditis belari TaxID=2138241 RepID=A0AAF3EKG5_9BILA
MANHQLLYGAKWSTEKKLVNQLVFRVAETPPTLAFAISVAVEGWVQDVGILLIPGFVDDPKPETISIPVIGIAGQIVTVVENPNSYNKLEPLTKVFVAHEKMVSPCSEVDPRDPEKVDITCPYDTMFFVYAGSIPNIPAPNKANLLINDFGGRPFYSRSTVTTIFTYTACIYCFTYYTPPIIETLNVLSTWTPPYYPWLLDRPLMLEMAETVGILMSPFENTFQWKVNDLIENGPGFLINLREEKTKVLVIPGIGGKTKGKLIGDSLSSPNTLKYVIVEQNEAVTVVPALDNYKFNGANGPAVGSSTILRPINAAARFWPHDICSKFPRKFDCPDETIFQSYAGGDPGLNQSANHLLVRGRSDELQIESTSTATSLFTDQQCAFCLEYDIDMKSNILESVYSLNRMSLLSPLYYPWTFDFYRMNDLLKDGCQFRRAFIATYPDIDKDLPTFTAEFTHLNSGTAEWKIWTNDECFDGEPTFTRNYTTLSERKIEDFEASCVEVSWCPSSLYDRQSGFLLIIRELPTCGFTHQLIDGNSPTFAFDAQDLFSYSANSTYKILPSTPSEFFLNASEKPLWIALSFKMEDEVNVLRKLASSPPNIGCQYDLFVLSSRTTNDQSDTGFLMTIDEGQPSFIESYLESRVYSLYIPLGQSSLMDASVTIFELYDGFLAITFKFQNASEETNEDTIQMSPGDSSLPANITRENVASVTIIWLADTTNSSHDGARVLVEVNGYDDRTTKESFHLSKYVWISIGGGILVTTILIVAGCIAGIRSGFFIRVLLSRRNPLAAQIRNTFSARPILKRMMDKAERKNEEWNHFS